MAYLLFRLEVVSTFAEGHPLAVLVTLIALFGYFSVLLRVRSPLLRDESLD
jgi:hypothetical protein